MPNHLADESSPYLLQHANNPVDWYPWGAEAIERARREQKPIFLSIGYSACHWCHVMEHESFENAAIARVMNENFVNVKVDREERPDLDQIYMGAVQLMTGRGGWPMSVFLTPQLKPFYGGTYWPPTARMGMPGFDQVLAAVADAWQQRREQAVEQAAALTEHLGRLGAGGEGGELGEHLLQAAVAALERSFDPTYGGFGGAPKFPHPIELRLLLSLARQPGKGRVLPFVTHTLERMAAGGIYDQLGGGFHRYSVDERWLVPHFEKMLYDNAQLAAAYVEAFLTTGNARFAQIARETCDYVLREMTDPAGGFYSTQDADSEGVEGKFFVWTPGEVAEVLGEAAAKTFCYVYDVSEQGNFEEQNILNLPKTIEQCAKILGRELPELEAELADARARLLAARERRVHPGLDDKVIVAWNGLMIDALALTAGALDEPSYLDAATAAARFLMAELRRSDGRLLHTWRHRKAKLNAYLDDYAALVNALVSLYEASFDERWIDTAVELADQMLHRFGDPDGQGFFFTSSDHEELISRQKDVQDGATPSGNGLAATGLVRLARLTGRGDYLAAAESAMHAALPLAQHAPSAVAQMLTALALHRSPARQIVILGDPRSAATAPLVAALRKGGLRDQAIAVRPADSTAWHRSAALAPLFEGKQPSGDEPAVFVCENFACRTPVSGPRAAELIASLARGEAAEL